MRILVVKLSALGDVVHAIPAINAIKKAHPDSVIDWLISDKFKEIIQSQKSLNKIYTLKNKKLKTYFEMIKILRKENYDLIIDLQGLMKTALISFLIKNRNTKIIGFCEPREKPARFFYTDLVDAGKIFDTSTHVIEKNMLIAKHLGADVKRNQDGYLLVNYGEMQSANGSHDPTLDNGKNQLKGAKKASDQAFKICIIPSTTWESKLWSASNWAYLIENLIKLSKVEIYILGTDADLQVVNSIYQSLDNSIQNHPNLKKYINQKKLNELPEFFREMNLIVGVDTGPLHIAAASVDPSSIKILGLFGPSSAKRTGPYGFNSINYSEMLGAIPKNKRSSKADSSMLLIPKEEVLNSIRGLLDISCKI